ncbi:hypothetical protein [Amycolatopsis sp. NPDC051903]|uniref:hypothetical protein n=1 Tax=Amycolatopsis sp. NPDC051903 TaxID=3363936 RepID=UPI00378CCF16
MNRRILLPLAAAAVFTALCAGVADAAPAGPAAVWAAPGVDLGSVLGPLGQPVDLLAPGYGLLTTVS